MFYADSFRRYLHPEVSTQNESAWFVEQNLRQTGRVLLNGETPQLFAKGHFYE